MRTTFLIKNGTIRSAIYLDKEIVNTLFIEIIYFNDFIPKIDALRNLVICGYQGIPYIKNIWSKHPLNNLFIELFIVPSLIFFFFFARFKATLISVVRRNGNVDLRTAWFIPF
jgi:hypothetical protein